MFAYYFASEPYQCLQHYMKCKVDNKCIPETQRCDNHNHCSDGEDEKDCSKWIVFTCMYFQYYMCLCMWPILFARITFWKMCSALILCVMVVI